MIFRNVVDVLGEYDMLTRIITSIVALVVFFVILFLNPIVFTTALSIIILIMLYECFHALQCNKSVKIIGYLSGVVMILGFHLGFYIEALALSIAAFMILVIAMHGKVNHKDILSPAMLTFYIVTFMSFIVKVRDDFSVYEMMLIFICAWTSDTGAYFAGTFFGKHKLIPRVSPKKTIEGSIGGILICSLSCVLYLFILRCFGREMTGIGYIAVAVAGMAASVMTQFGDLAASAIKRDCNVKDYGKIFPGHGGFMDRFDSVMFIAPFVYYFITLIKV